MSDQGQDSAAEKSFDPTPKRLEDARKKGDVPRSADVGAAASYLGLLLALGAAGVAMMQGSGSTLAIFLARAETLGPRLLDQGGPAVAAGLVGEVVVALLPLLVLPGICALLAILAQRAFVVAPSKLEPKLSRISLIENAKNKYGLTGIVEFSKTFVKMLAVTGVLAIFAMREVDNVVGLARAPAVAIPHEMMRLGLALLALITVLAIAIGGIDYFWQRFDHIRKLRMTLQDIRDETKESDGDPYLRSRRRQRAEEIAKNQMLADVPGADVVLVNPTHYAVALKWSREAGSAPHCVAKGVDEIAHAIRDTAMKSGVPVHRDAPTARALYGLVEIGQEVPPDHYRAVAAAIRFAEEMRRKARSRSYYTGEAG
ncbi:MAG: flagellar type III secretion system protein FlhB [Pseudomonadota bacterium]